MTTNRRPGCEFFEDVAMKRTDSVYPVQKRSATEGYPRWCSLGSLPELLRPENMRHRRLPDASHPQRRAGAFFTAPTIARSSLPLSHTSCRNCGNVI